MHNNTDNPSIQSENYQMADKLKNYGYYMVRRQSPSPSKLLSDIGNVYMGRQQQQNAGLANQNKTLKKLLKFQQKQEELFHLEKNIQVEELAYSYHYLRSQWTKYRSNMNMDVDQRLDRLSRVVSSIRHKTSQKLQNFKHQNSLKTSGKVDEILQGDYNQKLQQRYQGCCMQNEDLLVRLSNLAESNNGLQLKNKKLQDQLMKTKLKLKTMQRNYLDCSKKAVELEQALYNINLSNSKLKLQQKLTYTNIAQNFTVEIRGRLVKNGNNFTKISLQRLKQFLDDVQANMASCKSIADQPMRSQKIIHPIKVFKSIPMENNKDYYKQKDYIDGFQVEEAERSFKNSEYQNGGSRKVLSRRPSEELLKGCASQGSLQRSQQKRGSIKQLHPKDKFSHIEKAFYVKFQTIQNGSHQM